MLQNKFERPLDLIVKPSKIFHFYLGFIFLFSSVSVFISSLVVSVKFFLFFILLYLVFISFKKQNVNKIKSLKLNDDAWEIEVNNQIISAELQGECIVTYFIVWLNFTSCNSFGKKTQFHVLLLPDSADKDLLRRLRVRLRLLKNKATEETVLM